MLDRYEHSGTYRLHTYFYLHVAQSLLRQLSLTCCHGTKSDAVQQVIFLEHDQALFLHADSWEIYQVFNTQPKVHILYYSVKKTCDDNLHVRVTYDYNLKNSRIG